MPYSGPDVTNLSVSFGGAKSHNSIPASNRRNHNGHPKSYQKFKALEQGQADRSETTTITQGNLGDSYQASIIKKIRDLALFNLAIDSKLRSSDLVKIRVRDVTHSATVSRRAMVVQQKTKLPVQFEITEQTRDSISNWINLAELMSDDYLFKSRNRVSNHISTRQYSRIVDIWVKSIGLDPAEYGTHSMRRTKASLIYRRTKNLRAIQILLGHTKMESTVRYLGIEVDDALEMAEQTEA